MSAIERDYGGPVTFRVEGPTHRGWFCFDLVVRTGTLVKRHTDVESDSRWWHRLWHRIARPFRPWRHA